jgi:hypothetical protein
MPVFMKFCSVAAIALLVFAHLSPINRKPRTGLSGHIDHFLGYFAVTSIVCLAWPRPFVVGGALMAASALLEGLQVFWLHSTARAGRWRRLRLLNSSSEWPPLRHHPQPDGPETANCPKNASSYHS